MNPNLKNKKWDFIIVGTGMGAGPIGLKLAQSGFSVLFLEKGKSNLETDSLKGKFAEQFTSKNESRNETLKKAGRWSDPLLDRSQKQIHKLMPLIGSGVGGSSALYGALLERFQPSDFKQWPISYQNFTQYYEEAEKLFKVHRVQNFQHPANEYLAKYLSNCELHPYHLPIASNDNSVCNQCQSYLCSKGCKHDSGKICIETAIKQHNGYLITQCDVRKIITEGSDARGVSCEYMGSTEIFMAKNVIIAAGALKSPVLLQNSGIGNQSEAVGRYLMRHYVDLYALKIDNNPEIAKSKELGFNDFYQIEGQTFGNVQSFGRLPPVDVILNQMSEALRQNSPLVHTLFMMIQPLMRIVLHIILAKRLVMASIIEDEPQFENRVFSENGNICINYKISVKDQERITRFRKTLKKLFRPFNTLFIASAEKNEMLAHVCGTCRMGTDPKTSVVDPQNKVHGMKNLYVVDSSFFPTSGGTNPALTIAANSLRVAEILIAKFTRKVGYECSHVSEK